MLSRKLAALAALSLMTASTVAHAQSSAQALSVAPPAATAPMTGASDMEGGATIWIIGAVVLGLAIWGIIELTSDDDEPTSP